MGWLLWRLWATMHLECRMPLLGVSSNIFLGLSTLPIIWGAVLKKAQNNFFKNTVKILKSWPSAGTVIHGEEQ